LTTIIPILSQYCSKCCYSDKRGTVDNEERSDRPPLSALRDTRNLKWGCKIWQKTSTPRKLLIFLNSMGLDLCLIELFKDGTTKQSPVESGGLILVYIHIKWCIPVILVVFLHISWIQAVNRRYCYRTLYPPFLIYERLLITLYISIKTYYLVFILLEIIRNIEIFCYVSPIYSRHKNFQRYCWNCKSYHNKIVHGL
jgi:hypothetical protein